MEMNKKEYCILKQLEKSIEGKESYFAEVYCGGVFTVEQNVKEKGSNDQKHFKRQEMYSFIVMEQLDMTL